MLNADFYIGDREMTISDAVKCNLSSLSCLEVESLHWKTYRLFGKMVWLMLSLEKSLQCNCLLGGRRRHVSHLYIFTCTFFLTTMLYQQNQAEQCCFTNSSPDWCTTNAAVEEGLLLLGIIAERDWKLFTL